MTTTDRQGRFRFANARPGRLMLQIKAKGHAPELTPAMGKVAANPDPVTIQLGPAHTLEGRVVDSRGKPIADAFVGIDTWRTFRSLGVFLETDADGRFRWEDAPADPVRINVSQTGFTTVIMAAGHGRRRHRRDPPALGGDLGPDPRRRHGQADRTNPGRGRHAGPEGRRIPMGEASPGVRHPGRLQASVDVEQMPEFRLRIRAEGYEPFESRAFRAEERQVEYDVSMKRSGSPG